MGLEAIGKSKDTAVIEIKDPRTGTVVQNADGSNMTITVYGPYSSKYKRAIYDLSDAERPKDAVDAYEERGLQVLLGCIESWNISITEEPLEFSVDAAKMLFTDYRWVRAQIETVFSDSSYFLG